MIFYPRWKAQLQYKDHIDLRIITYDYNIFKNSELGSDLYIAIVLSTWKINSQDILSRDFKRF